MVKKTKLPKKSTKKIMKKTTPKKPAAKAAIRKVAKPVPKKPVTSRAGKIPSSAATKVKKPILEADDEEKEEGAEDWGTPSALSGKAAKGAGVAAIVRAPVVPDDEEVVEDFWGASIKPVPKDADEDDIWGDDEDEEDDMEGFTEEEK